MGHHYHSFCHKLQQPKWPLCKLISCPSLWGSGEIGGGQHHVSKDTGSLRTRHFSGWRSQLLMSTSGTEMKPLPLPIEIVWSGLSDPGDPYENPAVKWKSFIQLKVEVPLNPKCKSLVHLSSRSLQNLCTFGGLAAIHAKNHAKFLSSQITCLNKLPPHFAIEVRTWEFFWCPDTLTTHTVKVQNIAHHIHQAPHLWTTLPTFLGTMELSTIFPKEKWR